MPFEQVLDATETTADFACGGECIFLLTDHTGGTWKVEIIAPNPSSTPLGDPDFVFTKNDTQRFAVPANTKMRISGGTVGARGYVGEIIRRFSERL